MLRIAALAGSTIMLAAVGLRPSQQGDDIARRVAAAPDGLVKMTYAAREGVCGDGRSFIGDGTSTLRGWDVWFRDGLTMSGSGGDIASRCVRGPVRLMLVVRDHRVIDVQPFVGPSSAATERPGTDLGTVSTAQSSRYLLDLAASSGESVARTAILAASIADSVRIAPRLAQLASDRGRPTEVRESALRWLGRAGEREGDANASRTVRAILADRDDRTEVRERAIRVVGEQAAGAEYLRQAFRCLDEPSLRERALRVVAENGTRADMEWVRQVALDRAERTSIRERAVRLLAEMSDTRSLRALYDQLDAPALRERVVRAMADVGDADSRQWLHALVEQRSENAAIRERAIRTLADQGDVAYLRSVYRTLDDEGLRDRVLRSVAESGGGETAGWLRQVALDSAERASLRDRAVRSIAASGASTADLVRLYDAMNDHDLRYRLVSILAERGDRAARDKLRAIAENDPDERLRQRALRKLAEDR